MARIDRADRRWRRCLWLYNDSNKWDRIAHLDTQTGMTAIYAVSPGGRTATGGMVDYIITEWEIRGLRRLRIFGQRDKLRADRSKEA